MASRGLSLQRLKPLVSRPSINEGNTGSSESLATQSNGTDASVNSMNSDSTIDSATGNDSESLPQTGNDVSEELAALGLGTLGVVGTAALGMRKKKY